MMRTRIGCAHDRLLARDVMRRHVVTLHPEMTLREAAQIFIDREITGAPVVDREGRVIGVVSQTDLVRYDCEAAPKSPKASWYDGEAEPVTMPRGYHLEVPDDTRVHEVMTPAVWMTGETTPLRALSRTMVRRHIHRIPVTRDGTLAGIVTTMDILRGMLSHRDHRASPTRRSL